MDTYIKERAIRCTEFIIATKSTCREAASKFGVSESTVYHDITKNYQR